jgi:hypothetical protein
MNELIGQAIYLVIMITILALIVIGCGLMIKSVASKFFTSK